MHKFSGCKQFEFISFSGTFRWNVTKDKLLLSEVRFIEPYLNKVGSKEAGQRWTEVAEHLNSRDGFTETKEVFKAKPRLEEAASGIAVEPLTENEILMEEIVEIMQSLSSEQTSNTKISESKEREKALKMRGKAKQRRMQIIQTLMSQMKNVSQHPEEKGREEEDLMSSSTLRKMPVVKQS